MVKRSVKMAACLLFVLLTVSGCWDAVDLEDRDICTAVVLDKQGDDYALYTEIAEITEGAQSSPGGGQKKSRYVRGSGKNIPEARANLDQALDKPLYLGAVQTLIITEPMADAGIEEYVMRLRQLIEYRKTMDVIVTPDRPEELLGITPENESSVGFAIEDTLENLRKDGRAYHVSLADLLEKHSSRSPCYLLNTMSGQTGQVFPIGNTVMNGGKRLGFISNEESQGIIYFEKNHKRAESEFQLEFEGTTVTVETTQMGRLVKSGFHEDKALFTVRFSFDARIQYPAVHLVITKDKEHLIGEKVKEYLTKVISDTINKSQKEFKCDYLSFSQYFRIANPDVFYHKDWEDIFRNAEFDVQVSVRMLESKDVDYNPNSKV